MTQAVNLANFANNLDSSGGLNPSALNAATPISKGGTNATTAAGAATNLATEFGKLLYPVGSIYINASVSTNPATLLGFGTWVAFGAGRVPVGNGGGFTAGATGGSADATLVSHSHYGETGPELVTHNHNFTIGRDFAATKPSSTGIGIGPYGFTSSNGYEDTLTTTTESAFHSHNFTTSIAGTTATNANLQPYIVVYMWQRTV